MRKFFILLLAVSAAAAFSAQAKVHFTKDGFINIDGLGFSLVWADAK